MKFDKKSLCLYAVTDRTWLNSGTLYEQVEKAIKGGVTFVQLREKKLDEESFSNEALEIQKLCRKYDIPFVINDNVEIAKKINRSKSTISRELKRNTFDHFFLHPAK